MPLPALASESRCAGPGLQEGTHEFTFAGVPRTFRLTLPPGSSNDQPLPLIVLFHGWGGNENEFLQYDSVINAADQRGYAVVAPRGLGSGAPDHSLNSWSFSGSSTGLDRNGEPVCDSEITPDNSYPSCSEYSANSCAWTHCQQDDVAFFVALLDHLETQLCIDSDRIYAAGGSNGGMFTWELGQNPLSASRLRAIAPIIGMPHRTYTDGPGREGELPALSITSQLDPVSPPGGWGDMHFTTTSNGSDRYYYASASAITASWAQAHDCHVETQASLVATPWDEVECRSYCAGGAGLPQVLDCRADLGHDYELSWAWPLVLQFFDDHGEVVSP